MSQPPPLPTPAIDYAGPQTTPRDPEAKARATRISVGIVFDAAAFTGLMFLTRRFEQVFKDFNTDLPLISRLLLQTHRAFLDQYGWIVFWLLTALAVTAVCLIRPSIPAVPKRPWMRRVTNLLLMLGWIVPAIVALVALFMPMLNLIQSVSGPGK